MFELIFLGTSASNPSVNRGLSASMLLFREHRFLIDCGEGTQRQILRSGLGFKRLNKVLLTHSHLDHILGLGGLISTLARWEAMEKIDIYGGKATNQRVRDLLYKVVLRGNSTPTAINFINLEDNAIILQEKGFTVTAFGVSHRGPGCYGFKFEVEPRRPFLNDKAEALGVPAGPLRGSLVRGETVTLDDGTIITPDMVLGEEIPGTKYVHIGDVGKTDNLLEHCQDADVLTVEATYLDIDKELAAQFGHLTATQAATLAKQTNVKTLMLNHISRRYYERDIRAEARAIFPDTHVARDFDVCQFNTNTFNRTNPQAAHRQRK